MEKGLSIEHMQSEEPLELNNSGQEKMLVWVRMAALGVSLVLIPGGIGICGAFYFSKVAEINEMWTIGLIPFLCGGGLLLFFLLSKNFKASLKSE